MDSAYRSYNFPFGLCLSNVIHTLNGNGNSPLNSSLTMRSRTHFENNNTLLIDRPLEQRCNSRMNATGAQK